MGTIIFFNVHMNTGNGFDLSCLWSYWIHRIYIKEFMFYYIIKAVDDEVSTMEIMSAMKAQRIDVFPS